MRNLEALPRRCPWLSLALLLAVAPASAQQGDVGSEPTSQALALASIKAAANAALLDSLPGIIALRHELHQNPELSNREVETAGRVAAHLRSLGLEPRTGVAGTGVVALLRGGRPGPRVAVRADMDALPVTEDTDFAFRSTVRTELDGIEVGVAHACGHDVHMAVALGLASALTAVRDDLPGEVVFVFQPAEEGAPAGEEGGAEVMLADGVFADGAPAAMLALHAFSDLEVGQVGFTPGPAYAAVDQFRIHVRGTQTHGAYPHEGVDPVVLASQVVLALQTIPSRILPAQEPVVVTVGIVRGGERFNIIPAEVYLEGTVRSYGAGVSERVEELMRRILEGTTAAAGGGYELDYDRVTPATINPPELAWRLRPVLERAVGEGQVVDVEATMGGEDFAFFANEVPGFYFRLGVREPGGESGFIHTPTFRASDDAIAVGVGAMTALVMDLLGDPGAAGSDGGVAPAAIDDGADEGPGAESSAGPVR